jgi:hypothetical protein
VAQARGAFYSAVIEHQPHPTRSSTMTNTTTRQRLSSFAIAALLTVGMLLGVNGLATSDVSPTLLARVTAAVQG